MATLMHPITTEDLAKRNHLSGDPDYLAMGRSPHVRRRLPRFRRCLARAGLISAGEDRAAAHTIEDRVGRSPRGERRLEIASDHAYRCRFISEWKKTSALASSQSLAANNLRGGREDFGAIFPSSAATG